MFNGAEVYIELWSLPLEQQMEVDPGVWSEGSWNSHHAKHGQVFGLVGA